MLAKTDRQLLRNEALRIVGPAADSQDACRREIEALETLVDLARQTDAMPSPGALVRDMTPVLKSLSKTRKLLTKLPRLQRDLLFRGLPIAVAEVDATEFIAQLDRLTATVTFLCGTDVPAGSPRGSAAKYVCALHARNILLDFSSRKPSLYKDGPFFRLAAIFWALTSGEHDCDLSDYCDAVGCNRTFTS